MNIVDLIKDQVPSETIIKLSSLVGEDEAKTRSAIGAAVPALLSGLSSLASSGGGAQKLVSALNNFDSSSFGNLNGMLSGQAGSVLEQGSGILNSLFQGTTLSAMVSALSRFVGIGGGTMKSLMGYLTPLIMGAIAQRFSGKAATAQGLTNLFSEQKSNIAGALPRGLSFADMPGLASAGLASAGDVAHRESGAVQTAGSSAFKWLVPVLGAAAVLLLLWFAFGRSVTPAISKATNVVKEKAADVSDRSYFDTSVTDTAKAKLHDATQLGKDLTGYFTTASESLSGIKDLASAEAALPKLEELNSKLGTMSGLMDKLPAEARSSIASIAADKLTGLKALVDKVLNITGVREKLKPVLDEIVARLNALGGSSQP